MTDFGADEAFGPGAAKLKEHYGMERPVSTVQRTTEPHAECLYEQEVARVIEPGTTAGLLIGEMDGSMVPVVEPSPEAEDQRKGKVLSWKEVRLNRVHPKGRVTPVFGGRKVRPPAWLVGEPVGPAPASSVNSAPWYCTRWISNLWTLVTVEFAGTAQAPLHHFESHPLRARRLDLRGCVVARCRVGFAAAGACG